MKIASPKLATIALVAQKAVSAIRFFMAGLRVPGLERHRYCNSWAADAAGFGARLRQLCDCKCRDSAGLVWTRTTEWPRGQSPFANYCVSLAIRTYRHNG